MGRRGRRSKQLLDYLKEMLKCCKLKIEELDHTLWRTRFERDFEPAVKEIRGFNIYGSVHRNNILVYNSN